MIQHKEENVNVQGKRRDGRSRWALGAEPGTLRKEGKGSYPGRWIERGEVRTCFSDSCFLMKMSTCRERSAKGIWGSREIQRV